MSDIQDKLDRFHTLRTELDLTEEQAATVAARMVYGNGFQFLHDEIEDLERAIDEEDDGADAALDMLEDGLDYLEELARSKMDASIDETLREKV